MSHDHESYPILWGHGNRKNIAEHEDMIDPVQTHVSFLQFRQQVQRQGWASLSLSVRNPQRLFDCPSVRLQPYPRPNRFGIFHAAIVVTQEIVISLFFLTLFRLWHSSNTVDPAQILLIKFFFSCTLVTIILYPNVIPTKMSQEKNKVSSRIIDGLLLALLLRLLSPILRTLTSSYSSNTVYLLALGCMALHVISCNYRYAMGDTTIVVDTETTTENVITRPLFQGGTIGLNSSFLAIILFVSRFQTTDYITSSFGFLLLSIIMFALYPASRHAVALSLREKQGVYWSVHRLLYPGIITLASSFATLSACSSRREKLMFACMCLWTLVLAPLCTEWYMRSRSVILKGPWDISCVVQS